MKYYTILSISIISFLVCSCKEKNQRTKVPNEEVIELLKNNDLNFHKITYKSEKGDEISDSLKALRNEGKLAQVFYKNNKGEIDQIRLTKITSENKFFEIRVRELRKNVFSDIDYVEINCNESKQLYARALNRDQNVRQGLINNILQIDKLNSDTIISILDNCQWPKTKDEIESIWYIIQHGGTGKMAYYYPKFKNLVTLNLLEDSLMAKMEDRMLMYNGFPQIYGTQIAPPASFHEIEDVINVNKRRKEVGLCPIEQKARSMGFEFKLNDYLK